MAELADALVLGASGQPCEFESHWPHLMSEKGRFFAAVRSNILRDDLLCI